MRVVGFFFIQEDKHHISMKVWSNMQSNLKEKDNWSSQKLLHLLIKNMKLPSKSFFFLWTFQFQKTKQSLKQTNK